MNKRIIEYSSTDLLSSSALTENIVKCRWSKEKMNHKTKPAGI